MPEKPIQQMHRGEAEKKAHELCEFADQLGITARELEEAAPLTHADDLRQLVLDMDLVCKRLLDLGEVVPPVLFPVLRRREFIKAALENYSFYSYFKLLAANKLDRPFKLRGGTDLEILGYAFLRSLSVIRKKVDGILKDTKETHTTDGIHLVFNNGHDFGWVAPNINAREILGMEPKKAEGLVWRIQRVAEVSRGATTQIDRDTVYDLDFSDRRTSVEIINLEGLSPNGLTIIDDIKTEEGKTSTFKSLHKSSIHIGKLDIRRTDNEPEVNRISKELSEKIPHWLRHKRGWLRMIIRAQYGSGESALLAGGRQGLIPSQLYGGSHRINKPTHT